MMCFAFPYSLVVLSMTVMLYTMVPSSSASAHPKRALTLTSLAGHAHLQPAPAARAAKEVS
jgi:methionine-rich copper-binding protein CopC